MKHLIKRLPHSWQQTVREIVRYSLAIHPFTYLGNAVLVTLLGSILIGFFVLNASLLFKVCLLMSFLNFVMAGVVSIYKGFGK